MTTFKEISVGDYKKLLDDRQHTFAKHLKMLNYYKILKKEIIKMI